MTVSNRTVGTACSIFMIGSWRIFFKQLKFEKGTLSYKICFSVFDTAAWVANWIVSVGSYAGRQQRPWRRHPSETLENMPKIYIPQQLTANEIVRALKLTGKQQMLVEKNEVSLDYV